MTASTTVEKASTFYSWKILNAKFFSIFERFIADWGAAAAATRSARIYQSRKKTLRKSQNSRLHTFILIYLLLLSRTSENYSPHGASKRPYYKIITNRLYWTCDIHCQWYVRVGIMYEWLIRVIITSMRTTRNALSS